MEGACEWLNAHGHSEWINRSIVVCIAWPIESTHLQLTVYEGCRTLSLFYHFCQLMLYPSDCPTTQLHTMPCMNGVIHPKFCCDDISLGKFLHQYTELCVGLL